MNSISSNQKEKNNVIENEIKALKKDYYSHEMSQEQLEKLQQSMENIKMENKNITTQNSFVKYATLAASLAAAFIILPNTSSTIANAMEQIPVIGKLVNVVTFREYEYESEKQIANIEIPEVVIDEQAEHNEITETLENSIDEINMEIQTISEKIIDEFKTSIKDNEEYKDVIVDSEILTSTDEYFTLKLNCYQGTASGYEWNYYYTIDLSNGERLALKDIFIANADYITPISDNIKKQMEEQMAANEDVYYWLHDEFEEFNFKAITDDTSFYINENNNVVICFNEGDVAPMYMGSVEFEIPSTVLKDIK